MVPGRFSISRVGDRCFVCAFVASVGRYTLGKIYHGAALKTRVHNKITSCFLVLEQNGGSVTHLRCMAGAEKLLAT